MMKVIGSFILAAGLMVSSADAGCPGGVCRTPVRASVGWMQTHQPVRTVARRSVHSVQSCVQGVVVRQPVRSMGRKVLRCRPLRGLFGWGS